MKNSMIVALAVTMAVVLAVALPGRPVAQEARSSGQENTSHTVTRADIERWKTELSNWGRWGKDDQIGALNLITPAKRKAAAALVREGVAVSLASNAATKKDIDVPCPNEWAMLTASESGATDRIGYPCIHGAGTTHFDAF